MSVLESDLSSVFYPNNVRRLGTSSNPVMFQITLAKGVLFMNFLVNENGCQLVNALWKGQSDEESTRIRRLFGGVRTHF